MHDPEGRDKIRVGVGLLIVKDGRKVLIGKRKGSHGAGEYGGIGGHLHYGESLEQGVLRELSEECGVQVKNLRLLCISDLFTPKHYVDVGFVADWESGEPQTLEPDKIEGWEWCDMDDLPENLFGTEREYIEAYKTGKMYFTVGAMAN
jgi:8-oxo-dGTP diphosphatase